MNVEAGMKGFMNMVEGSEKTKMTSSMFKKKTWLQFP